MMAALAGALLAVSAAAVSARAESFTPLGVVELFTSQGCSSCPPADALLAELAETDGFVALAYHVDYWDYLGWKDTLGSAQFTQRQYDYAKSLGNRMVYTPQAVLNGRSHVNGSNRRLVVGGLEQMTSQGSGLDVKINVTRTNGSIVIETGASSDGTGDAHLVLVYFESDRSVKIERGENRGKVIRYVNSVTGVQTAGMWHGEKTRFELPESEIAKQGDGCAVLLQLVGPGGTPGPIIGATIIADGNS